MLPMRRSRYDARMDPAFHRHDDDRPAFQLALTKLGNSRFEFF